MTTLLQQTEIESAILTFEERNLLKIHYKDNIHLELKDVKELNVFYQNLNSGPMRVLAISGKFMTSTKEAREYAQARNSKAIGEAIVIHSLAQRLIAQFYTRFRKADHPTKVFANEKDARTWLYSLN